MAPAHLARPDLVTAAWLTEVLRRAGRLDRGEVTTFVTEPVGTGQMAESVRFRLEYDGADPAAPASVVGKFASRDPQSRSTGVAMRTYEVEVRFYQQLAGRLGVRTPRCDFAAVDVETGEFTLLLEDLAPARPGDQLAGCTPDEAALALEQLARLHAPRWGDPGLETVAWLHRTSELSVTLGAQLLPGLFPGFVARYRDRLAPEVVAVGERLMPRVHGYLADQPRPWTVQHGDYRLDNLLFGDGSRAPALAVVDWQTTIHGPGPADVSYFLGAGLAAEDRRAHEEALVREYHAALRAGGVEGYGWDRCWEDYRRYAYAGYLMAVGASMVVEQTERGDEMFLAMARRHAAQVVDLDSEALLR